MACSNETTTNKGSNGFLIIIVLYILLAILISGSIYY